MRNLNCFAESATAQTMATAKKTKRELTRLTVLVTVLERKLSDHSNNYHNTCTKVSSLMIFILLMTPDFCSIIFCIRMGEVLWVAGAGRTDGGRGRCCMLPLGVHL